ncbi:UNVERIFIED_CONTAM: hypothetical protein FKN15_038321 [Acipenser sinensis]
MLPYENATEMEIAIYQGIYLFDIIYIDSAYPASDSILENKQRTNQMNNLLRIISDLQVSCNYDYLVTLPHVQNYLMSVRYIEELQKFVEDDNYKLSLRIEPGSSSPRLVSSKEDLAVRYRRRPTCPDASVAASLPTPPVARHRKSHSLGNNPTGACPSRLSGSGMGGIAIEGPLRRKTLLKEGKKPAYKSTPCKKVLVIGWMVVLPDDPEHPDIFQLNDPDKGNVYKFQTGSRFHAILWHKHLEDACKSGRPQYNRITANNADIKYNRITANNADIKYNRITANNADIKYNRITANNADIKYNRITANNADIKYNRITANNADIKYNRITANNADIKYNRITANNADIKYNRITANNADIKYNRITANNADIKYNRITANNADIKYNRITANNADIKYNRITANNADIKYNRITANNADIKYNRITANNADIKYNRITANNADIKYNRITANNADIKYNRITANNADLTYSTGITQNRFVLSVHEVYQRMDGTKIQCL